MRRLTLKNGTVLDVEVAVIDNANRGDIYVCRVGQNYQVFVELYDFQSSVIEESSPVVVSLKMAMAHVASILTHNADSDFYDEA